ncbi:MAG: topoisomerase [Betaproteobacteria bacterium]|jgi:DNA topoisomerase-1|nr:topoisomerase [Betaproteobacteria bacterium]
MNSSNYSHARAAGLRYLNGSSCGIRRLHAGKGFRYAHQDGRAVRDAGTLARIRSLVIPPAWSDVRIAALEDAHLQATGRDARGRKQYRYHARWREFRDDVKYSRMADFAAALARIRSRVRRDLARPGLPREKVLAAVVRLLETTFVRIGNEEYARQNASFGLTTLRERQVRVRGAKLEFNFRGKSGVEHEVELSDRRLASIVRRMLDLPGYQLFCYVDEDGASRAVESSDVNAYIKSIAGEEFTSKDFRTWGGTVLCARALRALEPPASAAAGRRNVATAIASVAAELRNTKAVCRKCYVHPAVIEAYLAGQLQKAMRGLRDEAGVTRLLQGNPNHVEKSLRSRRVNVRVRQPRARSRQSDSQRTRRRGAEAAAAH